MNSALTLSHTQEEAAVVEEGTIAVAAEPADVATEVTVHEYLESIGEDGAGLAESVVESLTAAEYEASSWLSELHTMQSEGILSGFLLSLRQQPAPEMSVEMSAQEAKVEKRVAAAAAEEEERRRQFEQVRPPAHRQQKMLHSIQRGLHSTLLDLCNP